MFLRSIHRKKDGKDHRYFNIVETHQIASHKTVLRTVLHLGEINDQQQVAWRKTRSVFDQEQHDYANLNLFPDDSEIPLDAADSAQVKISDLELRRPHLFGRSPSNLPADAVGSNCAAKTGRRLKLERLERSLGTRNQCLQRPVVRLWRFGPFGFAR